MAKIEAPNREYNGVSASVEFKNGVGETDDENLIGWFREHGYEVTEDEENQTGEDEEKATKNRRRSRQA